MGRPARIYRHVFASLLLPCLVSAWWGCASGSDTQTSTGLTSAGGGGSGAGGGGTGGSILTMDGGNGGGDDGGSCTSTSADAHPVPLDLIFLIDQSGSMSGPKWIGTVKALKSFFNDHASDGIGAGLDLFPTSIPSDCDVSHYVTLKVPIAPLPDNAFALTNAMPADATIYGTPTYGALKGVLLNATAYQDAHPTHKVNVVLATDGNPDGCDGATVGQIAALAKSALDYNGVHTYVIGVAGSTIANLDKIAIGGGTTKAYDVTEDITQFSAKMAEIRSVAIGCDFEIPAAPHGNKINFDNVNFTYTPGGKTDAELLPRAKDLADCNDLPGWYYDDNAHPKTIVLCPASCTTVENDESAKVKVLFGCKSITN